MQRWYQVGRREPENEHIEGQERPHSGYPSVQMARTSLWGLARWEIPPAGKLLGNYSGVNKLPQTPVA